MSKKLHYNKNRVVLKIYHLRLRVVTGFRKKTMTIDNITRDDVLNSFKWYIYLAETKNIPVFINIGRNTRLLIPKKEL